MKTKGSIAIVSILLQEKSRSEMKIQFRLWSTAVLLIIGMLLMMAAASQSSSAAGSRYVAPGGKDSRNCASPSAPCATINRAIGKAISGETIYVAGGTYYGSGNEVVLLDKSLTLSGGWNGSFSQRNEESVIDGQGERSGVRVAEGTVAVMDRFTVQNCLNWGIFNAGTLAVVAFDVRSNPGSGIYNYGGTLTVSYSQVRDNISGGDGVGLSNANGMMTIDHTLISGNVMYQPNYNGDGGGAGIYHHNRGTTIVRNSTISNNSIVGGFNGSAIASGGYTTIAIVNCTISGNTGGGGNAIYSFVSAFDISSSTITGNEGGLVNLAGQIRLRDTILAGNGALDCYNDSAYPNGSVESLGYNLFGSLIGCSTVVSDLVGIDLPALPWAADEAVLPTRALVPPNPAINGGNPAGCTDNLDNVLESDERGQPRFGRCDIGAYELQPLGFSVKMASDATTQALQSETYTITLRNDGVADIPGVRLTDTLPISLTYTLGSLAATSGTAAYANGVITWTGTVSAGLGVSVTFGADVGSWYGAIKNQATISDGNEIYTRTAEIQVVPPLPDISATKTASPASVPETGGNVTFTYGVRNNCTEAATITTLSDDKPGTLAGDADCHVGTMLAGGASCSFTATFAVPAGDYPGSHVNVFSAAVADNYGKTDTATGSATVTYTDVLPDISATKTASPTTIPETGESVTFTYGVRNNSMEAATITALSDNKLGTLAGDADCHVGTVLAGSATCSFTATFAIPAADYPGSHVNVFSATAADGDGNSDTATGSATVVYTDVKPDISATKTASPTSVPEYGGKVTFTYTVKNNSAEAATITRMSDDKFGILQSGAESGAVDSGAAFGNVECDTGCHVGTVLASGASCWFKRTFAIPPGDYPGSHVNTFTAVAADDDGNTDTATGSATVTYTNSEPDISVTKVATPTHVVETGGDVVFGIVVKNTGKEDVTLTSLTDSVFGNLHGQGTCATGGLIPVGGRYSCKITKFLFGAPLTQHRNVVRAVGTDDEGTSDKSSDDATVTFDKLNVDIDVEKHVSVDGGKTWVDADTGTGPYLISGTNPQFKFVVTNAGNVPLASLRLTDSRSKLFYGSDLVTPCVIPATLPLQGSFTCYTTGAWVAGQHANTATASGSFTSKAGKTTTDSDTDDAHYFGAKPSYTVSKACATTQLTPQEGPALFNVTFVNTGNVTLTITADDGIGKLTLAAGATISYPVSVKGPFSGHATADNTVNTSSTYKDSAGHAWSADPHAHGSCRLGSRVNVLVLTRDIVDPSLSWTFSLWAGAGSFGKTRLATSSSSGDADGVLDFGNPNLDKALAYTLCEEGIPTFWAPVWQVDSNHDGVADKALVPYNPNASDSPPRDLGNRCVDLGAGTTVNLLTDGGTLLFEVNNTHLDTFSVYLPLVSR